MWLKQMTTLQLIATAPMGLEAVVAREVRALGYTDVQVENGRVLFAADARGICRANLWLRSADRVLLCLGAFVATTFEELFAGTRALPWPDWLPADAVFPVAGRSQGSQLSSVPACQAIVKKAVVEKMKERYGLNWFSETGARFPIEVALHKDTATLTIDTSGPGLHKRGYRKLSAQAPLKETLAAALVSLSRWDATRPFLDPFCGSGTLAIEAALIGRNLAPGLGRSFVAEAWPQVGPDLWRQARAEAQDLASLRRPLAIAASDCDPEVLALAAYHAKAAGCADAVALTCRPVAEVRPQGEYGCLVTNPPYGRRWGDPADAEQLYRELGQAVAGCPTWSVFALTAHPGFERHFGRRADKKRKLYNGRIECHFYQYLGPWPPRRPSNPAGSGSVFLDR